MTQGTKTEPPDDARTKRFPACRPPARAARTNETEGHRRIPVLWRTPIFLSSQSGRGPSQSPADDSVSITLLSSARPPRIWAVGRKRPPLCGGSPPATPPLARHLVHSSPPTFPASSIPPTRSRKGRPCARTRAPLIIRPRRGRPCACPQAHPIQLTPCKSWPGACPEPLQEPKNISSHCRHLLPPSCSSPKTYAPVPPPDSPLAPTSSLQL